MSVRAEQLLRGGKVLILERPPDRTFFGVVPRGGLPVLTYVEGVACERVSAQRILLVNLQTQQLLEVDLSLLDLRLARERARDLPSRLEASLHGENERQHEEHGQQQRPGNSCERHVFHKGVTQTRSKNGEPCAAWSSPRYSSPTTFAAFIRPNSTKT